MKPSHLVTPRTLGEATFYESGAAIERPPLYRQASGYSIAVSIIAVVIGAFAAYLWISSK